MRYFQESIVAVGLNHIAFFGGGLEKSLKNRTAPRKKKDQRTTIHNFHRPYVSLLRK